MNYELIKLCLLSLLLFGCSRGVNDNEVAGQTAKVYYELLLQEKYDDFVAGMDGCDSVPDDYREQMVANAKMFVAQQTEEHKGIKSFEVSRCEADSVEASAFLNVTFKDNTAETIVVPMVKRNGVWMMR